MTGRIDESHSLALAALIGPTVALYAALGMAPLFTLVAVAALALGWRRQPWRRIGTPGAMVLAVLLAWAALSLVWTIELPQSLYSLPRLAGITVGGLLLIVLARGMDEAGQRRVRLGLAVGMTLVLVCALIEIYVGGPGGARFYSNHNPSDPYIPRLGRGLTVCAVLLVPAMVGAWRCGFRRWSAAILAMTILVFVGSHTLSAKLALAAMPGVFLMTWRSRRLGGGMVGVIVSVVTLAFPLLALAPSPQQTSDDLPFLPNSSHHRLTIWVFTATRVLEHPLRGWGLEASRSIPGGEDEVAVWRPNPLRGGMDHVSEQYLPLHPHNGPGQIWLELGGVGAVLTCGLMLLLGRAIATAPDRIDAAMMASQTAAAFIVACVSYGIWQSWWLGSLWIAAALYAAVSTRRADPAAIRVGAGDFS